MIRIEIHGTETLYWNYNKMHFWWILILRRSRKYVFWCGKTITKAVALFFVPQQKNCTHKFIRINEILTQIFCAANLYFHALKLTRVCGCAATKQLIRKFIQKITQILSRIFHLIKRCLSVERIRQIEIRLGVDRNKKSHNFTDFFEKMTPPVGQS